MRELVYKLVDLYRFSDTDDNISFNAGIITGGVAANGIAAHAEMKGTSGIRRRQRAQDSQGAGGNLCQDVCSQNADKAGV